MAPGNAPGNITALARCDSEKNGMGEAPRLAAGHPSIARAPPGAVLLGMFALTDAQLALVMTAAGGLPVEKRSVFLERVAARLPPSRRLRPCANLTGRLGESQP